MPASFPRSLSHSFAAGLCRNGGGHGKSYFSAVTCSRHVRCSSSSVLPWAHVPCRVARVALPSLEDKWMLGEVPGWAPTLGLSLSTLGLNLSTSGLGPQLSPAGTSTPIRRLVLECGHSAHSESNRQGEGRWEEEG